MVHYQDRLEEEVPMGYKRDYKAIKEQLTVETTIRALNLEVKREGGQLRGPCKVCQSEDRALSINIEKRVFRCWASDMGGSLVDLAAHTLDCSFHDAASFLADFVGGKHDASRSHEPQRAAKPASEPERSGLEGVRNNLVWEHQNVQFLGLTPQSAETLGIGYQNKGWQKGSVLVPVRTETGELVGYWAIPAGAAVTFHKSVENNVVAFQRKAV
jgi:hypothetical protein